MHVHAGDQADRALLRRLADDYGPFDVVIDDGGHTAAQQVASFEALFPGLRPRGAYVVEDTHTSYWPAFGGGWPGARSSSACAASRR